MKVLVEEPTQAAIPVEFVLVEFGLVLIARREMKRRTKKSGAA